MPGNGYIHPLAFDLSSSMAQCLRSLTLRVMGSIHGITPTNLFTLLLAPLLQLTRGAGAVDDKDLTVSFNQGNT